MAAHNPDGHCYAAGSDGLTFVISPTWTRDWQDDYANIATNEANKAAAVNASRVRWLEATSQTGVGMSYRASQVVRAHPERGIRIPGSCVWLVLTPAPPTPRRLPNCNDDRWALHHGPGHQQRQLILLNGQCGALVVEDGDRLAWTSALDGVGSGRECCPYTPSPGKGQCWWCCSEFVGECDHLLEAAAMVAQMANIVSRRGSGLGTVVGEAVRAVRALGGEHQMLLERIAERALERSAARELDAGREVSSAAPAAAAAEDGTRTDGATA